MYALPLEKAPFKPKVLANKEFAYESKNLNYLFSI
jgi:hypothetical protein